MQRLRRKIRNFLKTNKQIEFKKKQTKKPKNELPAKSLAAEQRKKELVDSIDLDVDDVWDIFATTNKMAECR